MSRLVRTPPEKILTVSGAEICRISLGGDRFALVSLEDEERVSRYAWRLNKDGYPAKTAHRSRSSGERASSHLLHRYILGAPEDLVVDHVDGDPLNNLRSNLRLATIQQNTRNTRRSKNQQRGMFKGTSWDRASLKWKAGIKVNGKSIYLGLYADPVDAARAYDRAALEHFGEFAALNFPQEAS